MKKRQAEEAAAHLTFTWRQDMPESWKHWLRSVSYWNGELEQD